MKLTKRLAVGHSTVTKRVRNDKALMGHLFLHEDHQWRRGGERGGVRSEVAEDYCETLCSGYDRAIVHRNSQQLSLRAQDLHKIKPLKISM